MDAAATALKTLALIAAGDWDSAHALVQDDASSEAAWVHAHLHRIEGDDDNARYWYRKASRTPATGDVEAECRAIAAALQAGT